MITAITLTALPLALALPTPVWWFYALGPQLVICLGVGYAAARRRHANLVDWLALAFIASVFPVVGVVLMLWLWWRSPKASS